MSFHVPEHLRITVGNLASDKSYGNNGAFLVPSLRIKKNGLYRIVSDGAGWEHVSVSLYSKIHRCPTWAEMCRIKARFWDPEDVVVQIHPRESEYINHHSYTLHLWRQPGINIPTPPKMMIGPSS